MKNTTRLFIALPLLLTVLFLVSKASANTSSVHVSTSTQGGGESSVRVNSTTHTSSSTTTTTNGRTTVRIESNGKVTEYDSDKDEDVHMQSEDGTSKVDITRGGQSVSVQNSPKTTKDVEGASDKTDAKATPSAKPTQPESQVQGNEEKRQKSFDLRKFFEELFSRIFGRDVVASK